VLDVLEAEFARQADALARSGYWQADGSASPQDWVRHHCKLTGGAARAAVEVGARAAQLPASVESLEAGRISYGHLAHMARTVDSVSSGPSGNAPFDEQPLLAMAEAHSVSQFRDDCLHARHEADAAGALKNHVAAVDRRWLEFEPFGEDAVLVNGLLDRVGAATVRTAL
jgi:hypothetical protein